MANDRKLSQMAVNDRKLSQTLANGTKLSETVANKKFEMYVQTLLLLLVTVVSSLLVLLYIKLVVYKVSCILKSVTLPVKPLADTDRLFINCYARSYCYQS